MALEDDVPPGDGRPPDRGEARRRAFLEAARAEFLEHGFENANVNNVVRQAGGSLATLYARFGNKEGLFLAVMEDQHDRFAAALTPCAVDHLPLEDGLVALGEHFTRALMSREHLAFYRVIVAEGRRFPQLMQRYVGAGATRVREVVTGYMNGRVGADGRAIADPDMGASFFMELLRARHHYRALADETYTLSDAALAAHVRAAVRQFLNGACAP